MGGRCEGSKATSPQDSRSSLGSSRLTRSENRRFGRRVLVWPESVPCALHAASAGGHWRCLPRSWPGPGVSTVRPSKHVHCGIWPITTHLPCSGLDLVLGAEARVGDRSRQRVFSFNLRAMESGSNVRFAWLGIELGGSPVVWVAHTTCTDFISALDVGDLVVHPTTIVAIRAG